VAKEIYAMAMKSGLSEQDFAALYRFMNAEGPRQGNEDPGQGVEDPREGEVNVG
jgi:hypothetical protein